MPFQASPGAAQGPRQLVDRIVAEVNAEPILYSEIVEKVEKGPLVTVSEFPAGDKDTPYTRALWDAINHKLVMAKVDELELEVPDKDVDAQIAAMIGKHSREEFDQFLVSQGKDYATFREDIRQQMLIMRFRGRVLFPLVKITDKDVESFYLKESGSTAEAVSLFLRRIFLKVDPAAPASVKAEKSNLATDIHNKLLAGANFLELEKIYSDLGDAREGKEAEAYRLADLNSEIRAAVSTLAEGEASKPVPVGNGIFIFYLERRTFTGSREFQEQKQALEFKLRERELADQQRRWLKDAQKGSKIRVIND